MTQIFVASRNAKKIAEMERILAPLVPGVEVLGLDDVEFYEEPVEDAPTFEDNALIKARAGFAATGLPSVADDSGLCVDALNGMPGVLSARWSGQPKSDERNNQLLLDQLHDVPDERRGAHFACAIAFVHADADGTEQSLVVEGRMDGHVIRELRGSGGFGYDVLFVADDTAAVEGAAARTSAELSVEEKDAISHRGKAMREIGPQIAAVLAQA
jgi:XTP/dITP diphosphohydrolase